MIACQYILYVVTIVITIETESMKPNHSQNKMVWIVYLLLLDTVFLNKSLYYDCLTTKWNVGLPPLMSNNIGFENLRLKAFGFIRSSFKNSTIATLSLSILPSYPVV